MRRGLGLLELIRARLRRFVVTFCLTFRITYPFSPGPGRLSPDIILQKEGRENWNYDYGSVAQTKFTNDKQEFSVVRFYGDKDKAKAVYTYVPIPRLPRASSQLTPIIEVSTP